MNLGGRALQTSGVLALALLCSACSVGGVGVDVPLGAEDLSPCPVTTIDAGNLASGAAPECDLAGSSIKIEDSVVLRIPAVGDVQVHEGRTDDGVSYYIVNWGVPGVGVATVDANDQAIDIWGSTPEAIDLQREQLRISDVSVPE